MSKSSKLAELKAAREALNKISITLTYTLIGDETIFSLYQIAGKKYEEMTADEKDMVKNADSYLEKQKELVLAELDAKISVVASSED